MTTGWIKLHRSMLEHHLWSKEPFSYAQAWIDLLLHANHKPARVCIKTTVIEVARGQQCRSELTLSKEWRWSRNKVRRFLKLLENDKMIAQHTTHLTSVISICNYESFQGCDTTHDTTHDTAGGTTVDTGTEQQSIHKQECKNNKNVRSEEIKKENNSAGALVEVEKKTTSTPSVPNCPYEKIVDAYHKNCTTLNTVRILSDKRKKNLQARWRESPKHQSIDFWEKFFDYVNQSDFLTGRNNNSDRLFKADFEWLINSSNFIKVIEGKYHG